MRSEKMPAEEVQLLTGMFAIGAVVGLLSRYGPLSGWVALALPLLIPGVGLWLSWVFC